MNHQETSDSTSMRNDAFASRLALVIQHYHLNQSEFSRRLDTSAGFVGDVLRGLKKPGHEFLFRLKNMFNVSIDWLLTGEGTMHSAAKVDIELLRAAKLQTTVARLALVEGDVIAQELLLLIRDGLLDVSADNTKFSLYLNRIESNNADWCLALALYNSHLWTDNADFQRRNLLEAAISHFEVSKSVDALNSLAHSPKTVQINIGSLQRIAGRDYHEG